MHFLIKIIIKLRKIKKQNFRVSFFQLQFYNIIHVFYKLVPFGKEKCIFEPRDNWSQVNVHPSEDCGAPVSSSVIMYGRLSLTSSSFQVGHVDASFSDSSGIKKGKICSFFPSFCPGTIVLLISTSLKARLM